MVIAITGGAGYIGSHTALSLLSEGYEVVIIDNFSNSNPEVIKRMEYLSGQQIPVRRIDLRDGKELEAVFKEFQVDAVIHFAGMKAVGESVNNPLEYYDNNVGGTISLCKVMEKYRVYRLVFSSSATVYGVPKNVPISEDASLHTTNPYGRTKLMIEKMMHDIYLSNKEWSIALLRYFNPLGAHESGYIGEDPNGVPNNLMPYITQVAIGKRKVLNVYGNDYETRDGTGVRDYIHVNDLATGHIKALEKVMKETGVEAYNLGTGKGFSVLEVVKTFEDVSGRKIPYKFVNRRPGDIAICFADSSKAERELGWKAKRGIEEMCLHSWRWQKNNPNGYKKVELN